MAAGQAYAQAGKPGTAIPSVSVPAGTGLPDNKPIDIRGLHAGMPSDAALAVLRDHYKSQAIKLNVVSATLPNTNAPFAAFGVNDRRVDGDKSYDLLGAAFTSNANGNQVVSIISNVLYPAGQERNTAETVAAIKQKYGEPTQIDKSDYGLRFQYSFKSGRVLSGNPTCDPLTRLDNVALTTASVGNWQQAMYGAANTDRVLNISPDQRDCAAIMFIQLGYGRDRDDYNPKALREMRVVFFDAARFKAATARDAAVVKELEEKARSNAPAGSGASKL